MQLKVFIKLDEPLTLPINYNSIIQGIIYHSCTKIDKEYTKELHDYGINSDDTNKFKLFCFSNLYGTYKIENKKITFSNSIFFEIRSIDPYFIHTVYEGMNKYGIKFGDRLVKPNLRLENKVIQETSIQIKMLSPIIAFKNNDENKKDYLSPMDNEFIPYLQNNFIRKYNTYYNDDPNEINIEVIDVSHKDKCVTQFKNLYLTGWSGLYYIEGTPENLTFLYNVGLGSKNSQGFGLFDIDE